MQVFKPNDDIRHEELCLLLRKSILAPDVVPEIPTIEIIQDKVEVFTVLERKFHIDQKRMVEVCQ